MPIRAPKRSQLLISQTANAAAGAAKQNDASTSFKFDGGEALLFISGTFDGAQVALEIALDDGSGSPDTPWVQPTELLFLAAEVKGIRIPGECHLSASVATAGGSTSVSMTIQTR